MKTDGQIRHKLKQVIYRHRKEFVGKGLRLRPENCRHNETARLPIHASNRATLGVCQFVSEDGVWNNRVCDSSFGGDKQAVECPHYSCKNTKVTLTTGFRRKLGLDGTAIALGEIARDYPDVVALMWVLDEQHPKDSPQSNILAFFSDIEDEPITNTDEAAPENTP